MTTEIYMITGPWKKHTKHLIKTFLKLHDCHKYIFAKEKGKDGYTHLQARIAINDGTTYENLREYWESAHIERCSDSWTYEKKGGQFIADDDTNEIRRIRLGGKLRKWQKELIAQTNKQNNRTIDVLIDKNGNLGKSWLCNYLYEKRKAYYVPPTIDSVKGIIQFVAAGYDKQPYIIIDIPRSWKWTEQLYIGLESMKDGLVYDTRYTSNTRNIRGVKLIVLTNSTPKLDKLSIDRWRLWHVSESGNLEPINVVAASSKT